MSEERCGGCRFWQRLKHEPIGACRRYPPVMDIAGAYMATRDRAPLPELPEVLGIRLDSLTVQMDAAFWVQPTTHEDGWCGEFWALGKKEK